MSWLQGWGVCVQLGQALGSQGGLGVEAFSCQGGTDVMSWREFTLCSCPELGEQWGKEGDSAPDNSTQTGLQPRDPGQEQDVEELYLFISLQTPLQEEAFDEDDDINGRPVDPRVFNSRLLVVWAQPPWRPRGLRQDQALFQSTAPAPTYGVGSDAPALLPVALLL